MKLIVVGAGFTGGRLAARMAAAGAQVVATTRSAERRAELEKQGVEVSTWSWTHGLEQLGVESDDVVVYSVPPVDAASPADVVRMAERCRRFVYLSSTGVYGDYDEAEVDEESERNPTSTAGQARKEIEDALFDSDADAQIIRIVGIYGPGRTIDRYIAGGRYKLVDGGEKLTNRIHVDDLCSVIEAAIERAQRGPRAYIAADGNPVRVRDLVDWVVDHLGVERPDVVSLDTYREQRGDTAASRWASSYTAKNDRMLNELGVELAYPTVFDGYQAIFARD